MTPVRFKFVTPEGDPLGNTPFEIELPKAGYHPDPEGMVLPRIVEAVTDANGEALIELWPLLNPYQVSVWDPTAKSELFYRFIVPVLTGSATEIRLQDIIVTGALVSASMDPSILSQLIAVRAETQALRDSAATSLTTMQTLLPVTSATPPANPVPGTAWIDDTTGRTYVWWVDADSAQWVEYGAVISVNTTPLETQAANVLAPAVGSLTATNVAGQLAQIADQLDELAGPADDPGILTGVTATIADNAAYTFDVPVNSESGWLVATSNAGNVHLMAWYRASSSPASSKYAGTTNASIVNTVLTGTTGIDGNLTLGVQDGIIYIENRTGAEAEFRLQLL